MPILPVSALNQLPAHQRSAEEIRDRWITAVEKIHRIFGKILVLDDDPTGSQTVYDLPVYTGFSPDDLRAARRESSKTLYVLTNSRSLDEAGSEKLHRQLMRTWLAAGADAGLTDTVSGAAGSETLVLSRSDSTLRGHYPLETEVIRQELALGGYGVDGEILVPCFPEGGRFTFGDIHYVREGDFLIPAGETEFARDSSFSYTASDLKEYVAEKTGGAARASQVISISLESLRSGHTAAAAAVLAGAPAGSRIIVNAVSYDDLKVFAAALADALSGGRRYVFRCAAALVKVLAGLEDRPLLDAERLFGGMAPGAGLVAAGSYVGKTTRQLAALVERGLLSEVTLDIRKALSARDFPPEVRRAGKAVSRELASGRSVCLYTSNGGRREFLRAAESGEGLTDLELSARISAGLVELVASLGTAPAWVLTKGGITSHDIAAGAMGIRRAMVLGQLIPGVPVWRAGAESRWPGIPLVIFPGNVGDDGALASAVEKLLQER